MSNYEIYLAILVMTLVNLFTRAFPFLFFTKNHLPKSLDFLQRYFPATIMTILVVYSIKDVDYVNNYYGLKEFISVVFTIVIHLKLKNYLISIFGGTILYMFLVQFF